jgi:uncharacterized protein YjbJ (UPF0337 family)
MNKDRVVGSINDVVGSAKRKIGNLTGDTGLKVEGADQQAKGKVQNTWGKVKDAARDTQASVKESHQIKLDAERENRRVAAAKDRILLWFTSELSRGTTLIRDRANAVVPQSSPAAGSYS